MLAKVIHTAFIITIYLGSLPHHQRRKPSGFKLQEALRPSIHKCGNSTIKEDIMDDEDGNEVSSEFLDHLGGLSALTISTVFLYIMPIIYIP